MPYKTTWEQNGAFTKWWGQSSSAELVHFLECGQATLGFDSARYSIHDFTGCDSFSFDKGEVEYAAALDRVGAATNPKIKIAAITSQADVIEMINAYKQTMLSMYPVQIFTCESDAREWVK